MSTLASGFPDWQRITQWFGPPLKQATGYALGNGQKVEGPLDVRNFASIVVCVKPTGGTVTVTVTQTVPGGPAALAASSSFVCNAGNVLFEAFVLLAGAVTVTFQGSTPGETLDYAIVPSNTNVNAEVAALTQLGFQHNDAVVANETAIDLEDTPTLSWTFVDDPANLRMKISAFPRTQVAHNDVNFATEAILDLLDSAPIGWTMLDDAANSRVKATPGLLQNGAAAGSVYYWTGLLWAPSAQVLIDETNKGISAGGDTTWRRDSAAVWKTNGGVKFGSGATALSWYEEGTWTPVLKFGGASVGVAYTRQTGIYVRIGRLVFYTIDIFLSSKGSSVGAASLSGLPFTSHNSSYGTNAGQFFAFSGMAVALTEPIVAVDRNATTISLQDGVASLTDASFTNAAALQLGGVYLV